MGGPQAMMGGPQAMMGMMVRESAAFESTAIVFFLLPRCLLLSLTPYRNVSLFSSSIVVGFVCTGRHDGRHGPADAAAVAARRCGRCTASRRLWRRLWRRFWWIWRHVSSADCSLLCTLHSRTAPNCTKRSTVFYPCYLPVLVF